MYKDKIGMVENYHLHSFAWYAVVFEKWLKQLILSKQEAVWKRWKQ